MHLHKSRPIGLTYLHTRGIGGQVCTHCSSPEHGEQKLARPLVNPNPCPFRCGPARVAFGILSALIWSPNSVRGEEHQRRLHIPVDGHLHRLHHHHLSGITVYVRQGGCFAFPPRLSDVTLLSGTPRMFRSVADYL